VENEESDEALLAAIRGGSHPAFAALVRRHAVRFYALAYRFTQNRQDAEDIVQDAFLSLWEQPGSYRPEKGARFTTWFYRVVVNRGLNWQKRARPAPLGETEIPDGGMRQEDAAIARQEQAILEREIAALPERQRTALFLSLSDELSNAEAAKIMKVNLKALESLLSRAKATLKERMKNYGR
jgi:RNA polymerase sigma-70 factor (ECF subfamily)